MGAGSSVTGSKSSAINKSPIKREESDARIGSSEREVTRPVVKFLGEISYPIYITHYPLIYMQMSWVDSHKDSTRHPHLRRRLHLRTRHPRGIRSLSSLRSARA